MSLESTIAAGRAAAEARMDSVVAVKRKTGATATDASGLKVPVWATIHTSLPFRLDGGSSGDGGSRRVTVGGVEWEQATAVGHLPATTTNLADDDMLEVTSGEWTGTVWRVVKATVADQKTARRVPIEGVPRPTEWA